MFRKNAVTQMKNREIRAGIQLSTSSSFAEKNPTSLCASSR
jgi:hypothetical protein